MKYRQLIYLLLFLPVIGFGQFPHPIDTVPDSSSLAGMYGGEGTIMYLRQYSSTDTSGGGWFIARQSSETLGTNYFPHPSNGVQWVRRDTDALEQGFVADTTALKVLSLGEGKTAYLKQLASGNTNGGGWFVAVDSAYIESGGIAYDHPTAALQWVENYFLKTGITNPVSMGAIGDSTATRAVAIANNEAINRAIDFAYTTDKRFVLIPPGKYVFHTSVDTTQDGPNFGIMLEPNVEIRGAGMTSTILYTDSAFGVSFYLSETFDTAPYEDRVIKMSNFKLVGTTQYGDAGGGTLTGDQGIIVERPTADSVRFKMATFEDIHIQGFGGTALQASNINEVMASDIYVEDNNFAAINFSHCRDVILNSIIIDSTYFGMELAAGLRYDDRGEDSTTVFSMNNVIMTNTRKYGLRIYGGDWVGLNNVHISGMAGINPGTNDVGMWFTPQPVHSYEGFGDISINNSKIDGNGGAFYYGIAFESDNPAATDSSFGNIHLINTIITDCENPGVNIDSYDSTKVNSVEISGCTIYNNNTAGLNALTSTEVVINNVDYLHLHNNTIYYNTTSLSTGRMPIYLVNCYKPKIHDNNFGDPTGTYTYSVYMDSTTASKEPVIYNNQGLILESAFSDRTQTLNYYQQSYTDYRGTFTGGGLSVTGVLTTMINGGLYSVLYNTSGVAVDTVIQHDTAVTRGTASFTTTEVLDTVLISGAVVTDFYMLTPTGVAVDTLDVLMSSPRADSLIIFRPAGGTSGLSYDWFRIK